MDTNEAPKNKASETKESSRADLVLSKGQVAATARVADPQVKPKGQYKKRRTFSAAYKQRILAAYEACETVQERGKLLRGEGLYHSRICAWRDQQAAGKLSSSRKAKGEKRSDHLARENERLKKQLAQAQAIIDIQKKVSELLGTPIHSLEKNERES